MKLVKRQILSAASAGVLFCMGAASALAYEAPSLSFHPVASWNISDMVHPQTGDKHCLLVNEYNNGFILQFQGSKGNIESLSVDLRQKAFTQGQNKQITATLPGRSSVTLQAKAFNSDTLAINMSGQNSLFDALKSASALDIQIDENAFRFFMTGFANAAKSFDACMNPAPAAPVAGAIVQPPETSKVSMNEPVREAPSKLMQDMSAQAHDKYAEELSVLLQEPKEKVSAELQKAMKNQQELMADDALNKRPDDQAGQERYTAQLAEKMGTATEAATSAVPTPSLADDHTEITNAKVSPKKAEITWNSGAVTEEAAIKAPANEGGENNLIEDVKEWFGGGGSSDKPAVKSAEAAPEKVKESAEMEKAMQDSSILPMEEPPVVHSYKTPDMKINKEVIKHEADFSDSSLPVKEVDATVAKAPFSERYAASKTEERLQKRIERLERDNNALSSELELALRSGEKERLEISSDNWNLEQATMRYNEAERQLTKMGQQIQKERAECTYAKKELEMMLFDPQVTEEAQLARLSSLEKKIKDLQAQLDAARAGSQ